MDQELIARSMRELARVELSRAASSHHLRVLREAGLVESYKVGTRSFYHASARLDRWGELARVTSDAERFVRAMVALEARGEGCPRRDGKDAADREEHPDDHDAL